MLKTKSNGGFAGVEQARAKGNVLFAGAEQAREKRNLLSADAERWKQNTITCLQMRNKQEQKEMDDYTMVDDRK